MNINSKAIVEHRDNGNFVACITTPEGFKIHIGEHEKPQTACELAAAKLETFADDFKGLAFEQKLEGLNKK